MEPVYQEALEIVLRQRQIPHIREEKLKITHRDMLLKSEYKADFVCFGSGIVELKALSGFDPVHDAQVINYLKATSLERGLLINFGTPKLQFKRLVLSKDYLRKMRPQICAHLRNLRTKESIASMRSSPD